MTFLFTDIEGSTRLLQELGDGYAGALAEHRRVLREAFGRHGGIEVDTQGDAFFVAFARASDAVAAAVDAQAALGEGPVRVRMGLHTGEPTVTEEGYVGLDVHRAARIAAVGHGGQVLLSRPTRDLIGTSVRDLGEHRLKDLVASLRLFQVGHSDFPPLNSLYLTNLPVPATGFLGRERELEEIVSLLSRDEVRLLTLTGPGGTGKTRLAVQAAAECYERYPDGVWWVPLAPVREPAIVLDVISQRLGAKESLEGHIGDKQLLLLLDNFEHVLEAAPMLANLLGACANLNALVTSREPLHLGGEQGFPVPTLALAEAVDLFRVRARAVRPDFDANGEVSEICLRLDTLPLAIELAAARAKVLSPAAILSRLTQRLPLLAGGPQDLPERQRTLTDTIAWSYELLTDGEQRLFARLSVFAAGCRPESAAAVCVLEGEPKLEPFKGLSSLVEKSLLRQRDDMDGEPRFWMLETIREYAFERLGDRGEATTIRQQHAVQHLQLAEQAAEELYAMDFDSAAAWSTRAQWLDRLTAEHDNLRAALQWFRDQPDDRSYVRMVAALGPFWFGRGHLIEGGKRIRSALATRSQQPLDVQARLLDAAALLAMETGDYEQLARLSEESLLANRELGDTRATAHALRGLAAAADLQGDPARARLLMAEAAELFRSLGSKAGVAGTTLDLGISMLRQHDHEQARVLFAESLATFREIGSPIGQACALINLGVIDLAQSDLENAGKAFAGGLTLLHGLGANAPAGQTAAGLAGQAAVAIRQGDAYRAARLLGATDALLENAGLQLDPIDREWHRRTAADAQTELGEEPFREALLEGQRMTQAEALEYSLTTNVDLRGH